MNLIDVRFLIILAAIYALALTCGCGSSGTQALSVLNQASAVSPTPPSNLHLSFLTRPCDTAKGSRMAPVLRVAVLDASGNKVTTAHPLITIKMAGDPDALGGTAAVRACRGVASFQELIPKKEGKGYALTASAEGMADITSLPFHVTSPLQGLETIQVDPSALTVAAGHTASLIAVGTYSSDRNYDITSRVAWSSANPAVATVNSSGTVTAVKAGSTTIAAQAEGVTATLKITVTSAALTAIAISPSPVNIHEGLQHSYAAAGTFSDNSARDLTSELEWSSSDEKVAEITEAGTIRARAAGTATITASSPGVSRSIVQSSMPVTVTAAPTPGPLFSTYLGGNRAFSSTVVPFTFGQSTAVDGGGNTYVTGATSVSNLNTASAYQTSPVQGSTWTGFLAKYSPQGTLLWCTYLGGNGQTMGVGIGVMPQGNGVAVTGWTSSSDSFPVPEGSSVPNGFQPAYGGNNDAFVTVYDSGGILRYSTYLGGTGTEGPGLTFTDDNSSGNNLTVDGQGLVYVTGETYSPDFQCTTYALQPALNRGFQASPPPSDAYLCIVDPSKTGASSLVYSSFIGGAKNEKGHSITVDPSGSPITVTGYTDSDDFKTTRNAYREKPSNNKVTSNGFVAQFKCNAQAGGANPYSNHYSTYLGSTLEGARDDAYASAIGPGGIITVTGRTESYDFPVTQTNSIFSTAPFLIPGQAGDAPYVVKLNTSLYGTDSLIYGTFLGSGGQAGLGAFGTAIAADVYGDVYVGGEVLSAGVLYTPSPSPQPAPSLFPYTADAYSTSPLGQSSKTIINCLLMQISADGRTLDYSTYFGGGPNDRTYGLAADSSGAVLFTGLTFSKNFPLVNPAQKYPGNTKGQNAFIVKFGGFVQKKKEACH